MTFKSIVIFDKDNKQTGLFYLMLQYFIPDMMHAAASLYTNYNSMLYKVIFKSRKLPMSHKVGLSTSNILFSISIIYKK